MNRPAIMFAIMLALFVTALNQTILTTVLPRIVSDMGRLDDIAWLFSAYILAASIPALLVGRLSDIHGRRPVLLLGLLVFVAGACFGGLAQQFNQLLFARVLQGLGSGAVTITAFTAVADLYPPQQRGRWQGILGSVFGLASLPGPAVGGIMVDIAHWKWIFWSGIPLAALAMGLIALCYPVQRRAAKQRLNLPGMLLLLLAVLSLLLALDSTRPRIELLLPGLLSLTGFIMLERRAEQPLLPMSLYANQMFRLNNLIVFAMGASIFAAMLFLPLFLQQVLGNSAVVSGLLLMLLTLSLVVASGLSGLWMGKGLQPKHLAMGGLLLVSLGMLMLSQISIQLSLSPILFSIILIGLGLGLGMPVFNVGLQNAVEQGQIGVATASGQLSRQLGSSLGVTYMGSIMGQHLHSNLQGHGLREALGSGLSEVFVITAVMLLCSLLLVRYLKAQPEA